MKIGCTDSKTINAIMWLDICCKQTQGRRVDNITQYNKCRLPHSASNYFCSSSPLWLFAVVSSTRSVSGILDKNTAKNTETPHHGMRLINAHRVPFLNASRTRSCRSGGSASIAWIEVKSELAWDSEDMVEADSEPDRAAEDRKVFTFEERTA